MRSRDLPVPVPRVAAMVDANPAELAHVVQQVDVRDAQVVGVVVDFEGLRVVSIFGHYQPLVCRMQSLRTW